MKEAMTPWSIRLPTPLLDGIKHKAKTQRRSINGQVIFLLMAGLRCEDQFQPVTDLDRELSKSRTRKGKHGN